MSTADYTLNRPGIRQNFRYNEGMDRSSLPVRVTRLDRQGTEDDFAGTTPAERIGMVWPLTLEAWAFKGMTDAESRLPRHLVRVLRGKG
jgi:hypothetical protein